MRWARALLVPLAVCLAQCAKDPTGLFVTITAEPSLSTVINAAIFRTFDGATTGMTSHLGEYAFLLTPGQAYTLYVERTAGRNKVRVEVDGHFLAGGRFMMIPMPGSGLINDRAYVTYVEDQVLKVDLTLRSACTVARRGMPCPPDQRCDASGQCVSATVTNPPRHRW